MNPKTASLPIAKSGNKWLRRLAWFAGVVLVVIVTGYFARGFLWMTFRSYFFGRAYIAATEEYGRHLPTVDEVEILALEGSVPEGTPDSFSEDLGGHLGTVARGKVQGDDAEKTAAIWRSIPFGENYAALCYSPYYGLRFRQGGKLILETGVCWHCHVYTLPVGVFGQTRYGFDSKSEAAQKLLAALEQKVPHPHPASDAKAGRLAPQDRGFR